MTGAVVPCYLPYSAAARYIVTIWKAVWLYMRNILMVINVYFRKKLKLGRDWVWLSSSRFHLLLPQPASEFVDAIFIDSHIDECKGVTV